MISDSSRNALPKGGALRDETKTAARETKYSTTYGRVPFEAPETLPVGDLSY